MNNLLEALERTSGEFIDGYPTGNVNVGMTWEEHEAIKQELVKAEDLEKENTEYKKALEIVFKKNVDIRYLKTCNTLGDYNYCQYLSDELTEEEFNLLKKVFPCIKK